MSSGPVSVVPVAEVVGLVNGYADRTRVAAGLAGQPYPDPRTVVPSLPGMATAEAVAWADRLWPVFAAEPEVGAAALSGLARESRLVPRITADGVLAWSVEGDSERVGRSAALVAAVLGIVQDVGWARIGSCCASDCVDVYVDSGRRNPRRYCSDTCLNRTRVRNHRLSSRG
jgi:hypothetical protein